MKYIGLAETTFKKRFSNHKKSFNHERYENETELSKQYWKFKRQKKKPNRIVENRQTNWWIPTSLDEMQPLPG